MYAECRAERPANALRGFAPDVSPAWGCTSLHRLPSTIQALSVEQTGEGGMGAVSMAQQEALVRRRVTLKLIKAGHGHPGRSLLRFDAQRQALSMMDHPNIAKVLGAGATETGRLYFVMELSRAFGSPTTATRTICTPAA